MDGRPATDVVGFFRRLEVPEGCRKELLWGEILISPGPDRAHDSIVASVADQIPYELRHLPRTPGVRFPWEGSEPQPPIPHPLVAYFRSLEVPEGYKAELLRGEIVLSRGPAAAHRQGVRSVQDRTSEGHREHLRIADAGIPEEVSEPRPDLVVLERGAGPASRRTTPPGAVTMLVEVVSRTSVDRDYRVKRNVYAAGGFPAYLIIDPAVAQCVLLTEPTGTGDDADYAVRRTAGFGTPMPLDFLGIQLDTTGFQVLPGAGPRPGPCSRPRPGSHSRP
ncbi:Uma2 family endonuclease [Streptomyces chrestomyceticus]|uniref:Uma2 family endonuclease n=1 Tax=Streptomyces chrestomyceticus TaxID=68185 RepID=UPI0027DDADC1|nr:Uma2 family endonuclease [Streptomyces chrestomyceticus]